MCSSFEWVIENLTKNAVDAMDGKGSFAIILSQEGDRIFIDLSDTGKGISKQDFTKVFKPGFTSKKRGWAWACLLLRELLRNSTMGKFM